MKMQETGTEIKLDRGASITEVLSTKIKCFDFTGEWFDAYEKPESTGVWFIWGGSGNGKTNFVYSLCKYLTQFGKVGYNSLEEGKVSRSMQKAFKRIGMADVKGKLVMLCESMEVLKERLARRKSPDIIIIDSVQYAALTYAEFKKLKEQYRHKLFIFVSHADGKDPAGSVAKKIMYDANLKIWVEGYKAITKGRSIGPKGYYTVWDEGAAKYWGEEISNN